MLLPCLLIRPKYLEQTSLDDIDGGNGDMSVDADERIVVEVYAHVHDDEDDHT